MGYLLSTSSWNIQDSVGRKIGWGNLKLPHRMSLLVMASGLFILPKINFYLLLLNY